MALFFERMVKKKSTKPLIIIKILISIASISMLVMSIVKDNSIYFFWAFAILVVGSIIDGVESYFQKENKKLYLLEFIYGIILFILAFRFL
jgi:hypothetical protein